MNEFLIWPERKIFNIYVINFHIIVSFDGCTIISKTWFALRYSLMIPRPNLFFIIWKSKQWVWIANVHLEVDASKTEVWSMQFSKFSLLRQCICLRIRSKHLSTIIFTTKVQTKLSMSVKHSTAGKLSSSFEVRANILMFPERAFQVESDRI